MTGELCHWSTRTINAVVKHDTRTLSLVYQDNQCGGKA